MRPFLLWFHEDLETLVLTRTASPVLTKKRIS
jgi:hypothetical protein